MRTFAEALQERNLSPGDILTLDGQPTGKMYFLLKGSLTKQKTLNVTHQNFWPNPKHTWQQRDLSNRVEFKIESVAQPAILGLKECMDNGCWAVEYRAETSAHLYILNKRDI